jgi:hypothetical protein
MTAINSQFGNLIGQLEARANHENQIQLGGQKADR